MCDSVVSLVGTLAKTPEMIPCLEERLLATVFSVLEKYEQDEFMCIIPPALEMLTAMVQVRLCTHRSPSLASSNRLDAEWTRPPFLILDTGCCRGGPFSGVNAKMRAVKIVLDAIDPCVVKPW